MTATQPSIADKRHAFRRLHESGCFVIPNPWDVGSARYLESVGFKALATTSSGLAWSLGLADNHVPRDAVLRHLHELVAATAVPINADFESGFATDPAGVAESVRMAVSAGVAGMSIEDSTGRLDVPLYDMADAVARIRAARNAIDAAGGDTLLVARAEVFLVGAPRLDETIARLQAYANAGADCLYAPGLPTLEDVTAVVAAVHPKPLNVLVSGPGKFTIPQLAAIGVRRVSVGGGLARAAWGGFLQAARGLAEHGSFDGFAGAPSHAVLDAFFG
jgi:2-methylisocitrate lyase-like PEP mutase family enzyme